VIVSPAYAQAPAASPASDGGFTLIMIIGMFAIMYFLMIRPQMKRAKEQKSMIDALQKGDEVITAGGLVGKITKLGDQYMTIEIAPNTEIVVQRAAVQAPLPKGTIKNLQ
jgi:preprotein translocase subunit YajC